MTVLWSVKKKREFMICLILMLSDWWGLNVVICMKRRIRLTSCRKRSEDFPIANHLRPLCNLEMLLLPLSRLSYTGKAQNNPVVLKF